MSNLIRLAEKSGASRHFSPTEVLDELKQQIADGVNVKKLVIVSQREEDGLNVLCLDTAGSSPQDAVYMLVKAFALVEGKEVP